MRLYVIGDIHGQFDMLQAAHARIAADRTTVGDTTAPVIHLGDLVDRGPRSAEVITFLIEGIAAGRPWIVLKGNHDRIFESYVTDDMAPDMSFGAWFSSSMGGGETAASYGVDPSFWISGQRTRRKLAEAVPDDHKAFLSGLPIFHETDAHIFVHAGIRPGLPFSEQLEDDLLWIRNDFLNDTRDHGRLVVHGHTPIAEPTHYGNRVNLDSGAGYGRPLTAAVFEGRDCFVLEDGGRRKLEPVE